jgi:hypothetical protein
MVFHCLSLLSGLLGLVAAQLDLGLRLDGLLGATDGRDALDGGAAQVSAVAVLGSLVGDSLVGLAARLAVVVLNQVLGGLVGGTSLLADNGDTLLGSDNTDSLLVEETGVLAAVLAGQVKGVARELDTAIASGLGQEAVVVADDLPDQVRGNVGKSRGHCECEYRYTVMP